jgi:phage gpG-like protein
MARIKISGDFAKALDRWAELLEDSKVIVEQTSRVQAEVALTLIGETFEHETDPYGEKWDPKQVDDGRKVLHGETTRLRNGWHVVQTSMSGWRVDPAVEYAAYHQEPRGNSRPQRMMVPSRSRGLPKEWAEEFEAVALAVCHDHFAAAADGSKPKHKKPAKESPDGGGVGPGSRSRRKRRGGSFGLRDLKRLARRVGVIE